MNAVGSHDHVGLELFSASESYRALLGIDLFDRAAKVKFYVGIRKSGLSEYVVCVGSMDSQRVLLYAKFRGALVPVLCH